MTTMTLTIDGDRRQHPRVKMERPCKVFEPRAQRYLLATTRDVSSRSLLIDVPRILELKPGDKLHVGVAMKRRQGLLLGRDMIEATVVRTEHTVDDHTAVAVKFDDAETEADLASEPQLMRLAA